MQRITIKDLENVVDRINDATSSPKKTYTNDGKGGYKANIGNYHLSSAYGGWQLQRLVNKSGGVNTPLGGGFYSKREIYEKLHAFLMGVNSNAN